MAYLLPCPSCGHAHRVTTGDAGGWLNCQCGARVEVPTVRGLRALEEVRDTADRTGQWTARHGLALVGVLTALAGLALGLYLRYTVPPPDFSMTRLVANMTPEEAWALWTNRFRHGIGTWELKEGPQQQVIRRRYEQTKVIEYTSYAVAAAGFVVALAAWTLLKPRAAAPQKGPPKRREPAPQRK
jgi:hypothetical protein